MKTNKLSKKIIILSIGILLAGVMIFSFKDKQPIEGYDGMDCQKVGDLSTPRFNHLTTVLNDGTVLIAGGYNAYEKNGKLLKREENVNVLEAEIFDPETKQFRFVGNAYYPHKKKIAIKTKDGKIVFVNFIETFVDIEGYEIFDPKQSKFIKINIPYFKRYLSACDISNDKILLILGSDSSYKEENKKEYKNSDLYLYNAYTNTLSKVGIIKDVLNAPNPVKINKNNVLLISEHGEIYSVNLKDFKTKKIRNVAFSQMVTDAFKINEKEILIAYDNAKLEIYNTETNSSNLLNNIKIKNKKQTIFGSISVHNSFYQINSYNYLVMQDGECFYLLNIKDRTLKKIYGWDIDAKYPVITFLNNKQILFTGGEIYEGANSEPTSQNAAYFCTINTLDSVEED